MKKILFAVMAIVGLFLVMSTVRCDNRPDYVSYHNLTLGEDMDEVHKSMTSAGFEITAESPNGKGIHYENGKFLSYDTESILIGMDDYNKLEMILFTVIDDMAYVLFDSSMSLLNSPYVPIYGEPTDISISDDRHKYAVWDFEDKHIRLNLNSDTLSYMATSVPSTVEILRNDRN